MKFLQFVSQFAQREDGPSSVEYAVLLALIIIVCIAALTGLGSQSMVAFTKVADSMGS